LVMAAAMPTTSKMASAVAPAGSAATHWG
jgi:hypothetical protein